MGASVSNANTTVNELNATSIGLDQKTFNEIQNTCNSNTSQHNVLNIIGSNVTKLTTNQKNVGKNICVLQTAINTVQDSSAQSAMMAAIKTALEQKSAAGLGVAVSNSNQNTNITNKFDTHVSNETFNKAVTGCINNLDQSNVMNIIGSNVTDANLGQSNDSFMQCLSNNGATTEQKASAASTAGASTESTTKQDSEGYDPIGALSGLLGNYVYLILGISVLSVICSLGSSLISTGGAKSSNLQGSFDSSGNFAASFGNPGMAMSPQNFAPQ
jgi:hypothetical protein